MYYLQARDLHATGEETGDGAAHHGAWIATHDFVDGRIWVDCQAIDSATTLTVSIDFANADKTIIGTDKVGSLTAVTATGQQGVAMDRPLPAYIRASWTITNGKKATFRIAADLRGKRS